MATIDLYYLNMSQIRA